MKLPSLPTASSPAVDAADVLAAATRECRNVRTLTAEVAVSGSVGGQRVRVRLSVGVERPDSARLEANAPFGAPIFIFAATAGHATLLLPRDDRVLRDGNPERVLEAAAGVPLGAADLRTLLTGCLPDGEHGPLVAVGDDWRVLSTLRGDGRSSVYLRREHGSQPWRVVAAVEHRGEDIEVQGQARWAAAWRADYRDVLNGLPRTVHLASIDAAGGVTGAFDLTLALSQVDTNVTIDPAAFHVTVPATAQPITLEELRDARPGTRKN